MQFHLKISNLNYRTFNKNMYFLLNRCIFREISVLSGPCNRSFTTDNMKISNNRVVIQLIPSSRWISCAMPHHHHRRRRADLVWNPVKHSKGCCRWSISTSFFSLGFNSVHSSACLRPHKYHNNIYRLSALRC